MYGCRCILCPSQFSVRAIVLRPILTNSVPPISLHYRATISGVSFECLYLCLYECSDPYHHSIVMYLIVVAIQLHYYYNLVLKYPGKLSHQLLVARTQQYYTTDKIRNPIRVPWQGINNYHWPTESRLQLRWLSRWYW